MDVLKWTCALACVLTCAMAGAAPIEVDLKRLDGQTPEDAYLSFSGTRLSVSLDPPDGEWTYPEFESVQPLFATLTLGDAEIGAVFDADKQGGFYRRLFVDTDGDRNLNEEQPVLAPANSVDHGCRAAFPEITLSYPLGDALLSCTLGLSLNYYNEWQGRVRAFEIGSSLYCYGVDRSRYEAHVSIGDASYRLVLYDNNANGRFDDVFSMPRGKELAQRQARYGLYPKGDSLAVSPKGTPTDRTHKSRLGSHWLVDGNLYRVEVDIAHGKLRLHPVEADTVSVALPVDTDRIILVSKNGKTSVVATQPGTSVVVPAGEYVVQSYRLLRKDDQGVVWRLDANASKDTPYVTLAEGSALTYGEPFTPVAFVPEWSKDNVKVNQGEAQLAFVVEDTNKMVMTDLTRPDGKKGKIAMSTKKKDRPKEAIYRVVKPDGEKVVQGSFEYG